MSDSPLSDSQQPRGIQRGSPGETTYSQLSLLAILSLTLAVLYVLGLIVLGTIAFLRKEPLLLPVFSFVVPMAGILLGWLAFTQIKTSEGALTGSSLANWAIRLSLISGLLYGAYYSATNMAIHRQAQSYALQWLQLIKDGKLEEAFWMTLPQPRPPFGAGSLNAIETRFNSGSDFTKPDTFSGFLQQDYIRLMQNSGGQIEIGNPSLTSNSAERGGFVLTFRIPLKTKYSKFPLVVTVFGKTEKNQGRQYRIISQVTRTDNTNSSDITDDAALIEMLQSIRSSSSLAQTWVDRFREGNLGFCYELTLPIKNRKKLILDYIQASAEGLLVGFNSKRLAEPSTDSLNRFKTGEMIGLVDNFYCSSDLKKETILKAVRNLLTPGGDWMFFPGKGLTRGKAPFPLISRVSDKDVVFRYDYQMILDKIVGQDDNILVEFQVKVREEDVPESPGKKNFYVEGVDLIRARVPPPPSASGPSATPPPKPPIPGR